MCKNLDAFSSVENNVAFALVYPRLSLCFSTSVFEMSLPAGYSPAAYGNSSDDLGGWAVIASGSGLVVILIFASIRLYTRYPFRSRLLYDDVAIILSSVYPLSGRS